MADHDIDPRHSDLHYPHSRTGVPTRTEPLCKLCQHPDRGAWEDVLRSKALRQPFQVGAVAWRCTEKEIKRLAPSIWGMAFNSGSAASHMRKHWAPNEEGALTPAAQDDVTATMRRIAEHGMSKVSADDYLDAVIAAGWAKLRAAPHRVTVSDALSAARTRVQHSEQESIAKLMLTLAAGTEEALKRIPPPGQTTPETEPIVIHEIEAEVVEPSAEDKAQEALRAQSRAEHEASVQGILEAQQAEGQPPEPPDT